jgi:hypothetical protein
LLYKEKDDGRGSGNLGQNLANVLVIFYW